MHEKKESLTEAIARKLWSFFKEAKQVTDVTLPKKKGKYGNRVEFC